MYEMDPLADDTVVVRGGLMGLEALRASLAVGMAEDGFYNLSFWGDNDLESVEAVTERSPIPNGQVRVSTVGRLRAIGHEPYRTDPWPHLTVRFEAEPTDENLEHLVSAFDQAVPNPRPWG